MNKEQKERKLLLTILLWVLFLMPIAGMMEKVAKLSLGDFTDMLSFQNLQVVEVFGDYELNAYDVRKTPRMIVVARKMR